MIVDYGVGGFGDDAAVLALETKVDRLRILHADAQIGGVGHGRYGGAEEHVAAQILERKLEVDLSVGLIERDELAFG